MKKTTFTLVLTLIALPCSANEPGSYAQEYLDEKIAAWEAKYEQCKSVESERELPEPDILQQLRKYDDQQLREYLITRSHIALDQCTQPEIGELDYTVLALTNDKDLVESVKQDAKKVGAMVHGVTWSMRQTYHDLPEELKSQFADIEYFDEPFSSFSILEALDAL